MNYVLEEAVPAIGLPKPKKIVIDGVERGDVTPSLVVDEVQWHASIRLGSCLLPAAGLAQGFGRTPEEAIVNSIVRAKKERDEFSAALAALEKSLGSTTAAPKLITTS